MSSKIKIILSHTPIVSLLREIYIYIYLAERRNNDGVRQ